MNVLFLSHTDIGSTFRVGSHHLSREVARRGNDVVHVSTPYSLAHRMLGRPRTAESRFVDGVSYVVPRTFTPSGSSPRWLDSVQGRVVARRLLEELPSGTSFDVVLVDQPRLIEVARCVGRRLLVYRPTDVHPEGRLRSMELEMVRICDAIVATSRYVMESLPDRGVPRLVLENGVEYGRFDRPSTAIRSGVVYVGAVDERFDWALVRELAAQHPSETFEIYGTVLDAPRDLPGNIALCGPIAYEDVPRVLSLARIGLIPLVTSLRNQGRSPMKFYEYLAAGLFVLARRTDSLAARRSPGVSLYSSPAEASDQLRALLTADVFANERGKIAAAEMDWGRRAEELEAFIRNVGATQGRCF